MRSYCHSTVGRTVEEGSGTQQAVTRGSTHQLELADRPAGRHGLRRGDDAIRIDAIVPIEIGNAAGLAEMLDTE